ncbi:MAG: 5'-methylthioadenosine/adenosylhomocysteine nucleosidase [Christensenellales bacterium]|nr:5'-methylthioadenosine/adenosylhomocysteine nucleosidase [Clostridiales bacterium]
MTIGIIIAMQEEAKPYKKHILTDQEIYGKKFLIGKIADKDIVICLSGIGKVNAAFACALMVERFKPDLIINTGVSGGLGVTKAYDIVIADKAVQHDADTTALGDPKGMVSTVNKIYFDTSKKHNELIKAYLDNACVGTVACGDQFIADKRLASEIARQFNAIAVDMESAAVAQVAYITKTDLVIIRGISDGADEEAPVDFMSLIEQISQKIYEAVKKVIERL